MSYFDVFNPTWTGQAGMPGTLNAIPAGTAPTINTTGAPTGGTDAPGSATPGGTFNMFNAPGVGTPQTANPLSNAPSPYQGNKGGVFDMFNAPGINPSTGLSYAPIDRVTNELVNQGTPRPMNGLFRLGRR